MPLIDADSDVFSNLDREMRIEVAQMYRSTSADSLRALGSALADSQPPHVLGKLLHKIKGQSTFVAAMRFKALVERMEAAVDSFGRPELELLKATNDATLVELDKHLLRSLGE